VVPVQAPNPRSSAAQMQSIPFGSLASARLATFLAQPGKQWLASYLRGKIFAGHSHHRELGTGGWLPGGSNSSQSVFHLRCKYCFSL
jgi:hypothetical protein